MSVIVTPNETALIETFNRRNISINIENLLVGDVHIVKDGITIYIIERKAKGDLDASIKDGRYHEQKSRLIETGLARKNIIYVIEQLNKPRDHAAHKRIWSAICNSQHRDGFSVFQTKTIDETVDYIVSLKTSVEKFDDGMGDADKSVNINIRKYQVTSQEWFKYSLTLIPKVSLSISTQIVEKYPNITALISAIEDDGDNCLADLKYGKASRRIGKKLSQQICNTIIENY